MKEDTATDVISEMVSENLIDADDQSLARRKLEGAIREHYISMSSAASSSSEQGGSVNSGENMDTRYSMASPVEV